LKVYINGCWIEGVSNVKIDKDPNSSRSKLYMTTCDADFMLLLDQLDLKFYNCGTEQLKEKLGQIQICPDHEIEVEVL